MSKGLGNPAAVAVVGGIANSDQGQKAIGQVGTAVKVALLVGGTVLTAKYGWSQYKKARSKRYARNNAGNPHLTAAAIIFNSFTRFEFPGFLGLLLPALEVSTNEAALNDIASKITDVKEVAKAYYILFDRELFQDTQKGLDTEEMQTFWSIINAPQNNDNATTLYPVGSTLYVAERNGIIVNKAVMSSGVWSGTNELYGDFAFNVKIGKVIANGIYENENYYIIEDCFAFGLGCKEGVVLQNQITNQKI